MNWSLKLRISDTKEQPIIMSHITGSIGRSSGGSCRFSLLQSTRNAQLFYSNYLSDSVCLQSQIWQINVMQSRKPHISSRASWVLAFHSILGSLLGMCSLFLCLERCLGNEKQKNISSRALKWTIQGGGWEGGYNRLVVGRQRWWWEAT